MLKYIVELLVIAIVAALLWYLQHLSLKHKRWAIVGLILPIFCLGIYLISVITSFVATVPWKSGLGTFAVMFGVTASMYIRRKKGNPGQPG